MQEIHECKVVIIIDADGNYAVGASAEQAKDNYEKDIGSDDETPKRHVVITCNIPAPEAQRVTVNIPAPKEAPVTIDV